MPVRRWPISSPASYGRSPPRVRRACRSFPDVPTLAEVGIDGVVVEGFIGLAAPKGTPQPIVKKLESEVMAILKLPDVAGRIKQIGLIPDGSTGAAFHDRIAKDIPKYTAVAKAAHIEFD